MRYIVIRDVQEFHLDHNLSARNQTLFLSEKAWSVTRISFEDSVRNSSFQRIDHDPFIILLTVICANSQFIYSCVKLYFISLCTAAPSPHKDRDVSLLDFFEWRERLYTSFILFTRWGRS